MKINGHRIALTIDNIEKVASVTFELPHRRGARGIGPRSESLRGQAPILRKELAQRGLPEKITLVDSAAMPWLNADNSSAQSGTNDGIAPVTLTSSNGYKFAAGGMFTITYLSGLTQPFGGMPLFDAAGDPGYDANNNPGSSGNFFSSLYVNPAQYPAFLRALIGTFANSAGTPFATGDGPYNVTVPTGATQLQLGIDDDIFSDSTGSLTVSVSGPTIPATVPEPGAYAMIGSLGLVGAGVLMRRRAR